MDVAIEHVFLTVPQMIVLGVVAVLVAAVGLILYKTAHTAEPEHLIMIIGASVLIIGGILGGSAGAGIFRPGLAPSTVSDIRAAAEDVYGVTLTDDSVRQLFAGAPANPEAGSTGLYGATDIAYQNNLERVTLVWMEDEWQLRTYVFSTAGIQAAVGGELERLPENEWQ